MVPAGIFRRFFALFVDQAIFLSLFLLFAFIFFGTVEILLALVGLNLGRQGSWILFYGLFVVISLVIHLLYFALYESSYKKGTPGQRLLGLNVCDLSYEKVSFKMASIRYIIWAVPSLLIEMIRELYAGEPTGIGAFLVLILFGIEIAWIAPIFFTERRQAVYDMLTDVQVVKIPKQQF